MIYLSTRTSWQKSATKISLHNMNDVIYPYPLIESQFFEDINSLTRKHQHYNAEMGLLNIAGEEKKALDPDFWILIWALDFRDRMFQILIERHPDYGGKGAIAAVGPTDLLEFFGSMKNNAILPTLTLINSPEKMKSVVVVVSRPKNYQERSKEKNQYQAMGRFQNWINKLKNTPNTKGQWFPSNAPTCPVCNGPIVGIQDGYKIGFGMLVCPDCGHMERKEIVKQKAYEKKF
ncbi:hypothetical protein NEF87_003302 [Candidatus Lokiarchaeum ossiferum]|uniref:Uncharacterized protein n=1 Tax=Candidatus Lokiarchaeum ossiferum TaxID=2951803 RepID=A0ABY6HXE3_9ARCH|nr:hypothetical protein NEF87_003302 [Candidatus Lokiarchaeum sp. B-35]